MKVEPFSAGFRVVRRFLRLKSSVFFFRKALKALDISKLLARSLPGVLLGGLDLPPHLGERSKRL